MKEVKEVAAKEAKWCGPGLSWIEPKRNGILDPSASSRDLVFAATGGGSRAVGAMGKEERFENFPVQMCDQSFESVNNDVVPQKMFKQKVPEEKFEGTFRNPKYVMKTTDITY